MKLKKRLDILIQEQFTQYSRTQIQSFIMQNKVSVENKIINKAGTLIDQEKQITLNIEIPKYVCRAGFKLEKALDHFNIDPTGLTILDAGLSTGGFTDCLLSRGAAKIYGVDVGIGQAHEKIRANPKVVVMEKTNLRYLEKIEIKEKVDLVTLDLSFISVLKVMDTVSNLLNQNGQLIILIKPQFEAKKYEVGKGGIIRDYSVHTRIIGYIEIEIQKFGFKHHGTIESPITGTMGNKEFLSYFTKIIL